MEGSGANPGKGARSFEVYAKEAWVVGCSLVDFPHQHASAQVVGLPAQDLERLYPGVFDTPEAELESAQGHAGFRA